MNEYKIIDECKIVDNDNDVKNGGGGITRTIVSLPDTEVFGVYNCIVDRDSFKDDNENRTRSFNITSRFPDVSVVAMSDNLKYVYNTYAKKWLKLCHLRYTKLAVVSNTSLNESDVVLHITCNDFIFDEAKNRHTSSIKNGGCVINSCSFIDVDTIEKCGVQSTINTSIENINTSNDLIFTTSSKYEKVNYDNLTYYLDLYINDEFICTVYNGYILNRFGTVFANSSGNYFGLVSSNFLPLNYGIYEGYIKNKQLPVDIKLKKHNSETIANTFVCTLVADNTYVKYVTYESATGEVTSNLSNGYFFYCYLDVMNFDEQYIKIRCFDKNKADALKYCRFSLHAIFTNMNDEPYKDIALNKNWTDDWHLYTELDRVDEVTLGLKIPCDFIRRFPASYSKVRTCNIILDPSEQNYKNEIPTLFNTHNI